MDIGSILAAIVRKILSEVTFKVKPDEWETTAMNRMDENHEKRTQCLEMLKEDILGSVGSVSVRLVSVCFSSR